MKTILYLIPHLERSSPVTQLFEVIRYLDKDKYRPIILSFFKEKTDSMQSDFSSNNIRIVNGNFERWQILGQQKLLNKVINDESIDIIHSCSVLTDGICSSLNIDIPLIITLHCYIYEDILTRYGRVIGSVLCYREKKTIKKATKAITVSKTLAEKYEAKINRPYIAIQNGINVDFWKQKDGKSQKEIRKVLGIAEDAFVIISTNLLDSIKDPLLLISAFSDANTPNSLLVMLGDGNMQNECRKYEAENIVFTGRVSNVKDYLYAADVFVSASKSEGLPFAVLEAACTGIRMFLSDIPQHREVMGNAEGIKYFSCGDKQMLINYIKEGVSDRVQYDLNQFTSEKMSSQYQKIYASI